MANKFSLKQRQNRYSNDSVLSVDVSTSGMHNIYQYALLEEKLVDELRQIAFENAIKTQPFNRSQGLGATGSSILMWIYEFYQNHSAYFAILAKVPGILNLLKLITHKLVGVFCWEARVKPQKMKKYFII